MFPGEKKARSMYAKMTKSLGTGREECVVITRRLYNDQTLVGQVQHAGHKRYPV